MIGMIASNPLSPPFQALLDALGAVLAFFYRFVPNYGVAIILLTLVIRIVLLPLAFKQIRSMQAMQVIQPKVKELQRKYKGNREQLNQAMMALYKEHGVNPLSGCLPLLAQFPVLIALFAVLRFPQGLTHVPADTRLYDDLIHQKASFLSVNLLCSAAQAGTTVKLDDRALADVPDLKGKPPLNCGHGVPVRIPYYVFALLMMGTTYVQQRQMTRASPAAGQQQQMMTRIMPVLFGVWGFIFPAGLVVYWTTTNTVQIIQQRYMLAKQGPLGAGAAGDGQRRQAPQKSAELRKSSGSPPQQQRGGQKSRPAAGAGGGRPQGQQSRGGRNAGSRKKRRKR